MLNDIIPKIRPADNSIMQNTQRRLDNLAKLPGSLGDLETAIVRLAGLQRTEYPNISKKAAVIFCADNGVVSQGISPSDQRITAAQAINFVRGGAVINAFSRHSGADVIVVDVGISTQYHEPRIINRAIRRGTNSIVKGSAMSREECIAAINVGINTAISLHQKGYHLLIAGEMGIGNTTTASAVSAVLLNKPPEQVTGRGAGSLDGIAHKVEIIRKAIKINQPNADDPIDIISKVGGLDIAAMCGLYLGGAATRTAVMIDGLISSTAALCAVRLAPDAKCSLFPSHCSAEPAGHFLLDELDFRPLISAGLCLGEGTGGILAAQLLDNALAAYNEVVGIDEI